MINIFYSPLEQFEESPWLVSSFVIPMLFFFFLDSDDYENYSSPIVPDVSEFIGTNLEKNEFLFRQQIITENSASEGSINDFLYYIFFFFVALNVLGLLPGVGTINAQIQFVLPLAISSFILVIISGFYRFGLSYFSFFFPAGVPLLLAPLLIPIEFISYFARPISLGVRMFANMLAGHALLVILFALLGMAMSSFNIFKFVVILFPFVVVLCVCLLEFAVSILQSYVFVTLLGNYFRELTQSH